MQKSACVCFSRERLLGSHWSLKVLQGPTKTKNDSCVPSAHGLRKWVQDTALPEAGTAGLSSSAPHSPGTQVVGYLALWRGGSVWGVSSVASKVLKILRCNQPGRLTWRVFLSGPRKRRICYELHASERARETGSVRVQESQLLRSLKAFAVFPNWPDPLL